MLLSVTGCVLPIIWTTLNMGSHTLSHICEVLHITQITQQFRRLGVPLIVTFTRGNRENVVAIGLIKCGRPCCKGSLLDNSRWR
jgi:hypothetical protein